MYDILVGIQILIHKLQMYLIYGYYVRKLVHEQYVLK